MRRRIPLNAVRAFEAAARHQSLVRAADELCVTPTAVSHQIRLLEDFLQFKLFLRKNSRLELTPESRMCLEHLTSALDTIDDALNMLRKPKEARDRLMVGASASVASLWLMPRLKGFVRQAPEVDVSITTFVDRMAIEAKNPDLWICNWQTDMDRRIEVLLEEEILPVCSPKLAEEYGDLSFESLAELPLIHVDRSKPDLNGQYALQPGRAGDRRRQGRPRRLARPLDPHRGGPGQGRTGADRRSLPDPQQVLRRLRLALGRPGRQVQGLAVRPSELAARPRHPVVSIWA